MKTLILATRPKTLVAALCPVFLGSALAFHEGTFNATLFFFTLLTALAIQVTTNFANDYFDFLKGADTPARKGPVRVTAAGLISPKKMKRILILLFTFSALSGLYLVYVGGWPIACLLILSLFLAFFYTAGPFPLAYIGLGDLFVFIFFGPVAVIGTYFLQTQKLSPTALLLGVSPGLLSAAILMINNLRDIDEDRTAQKKTLMVRFGKRFGKRLYVATLSLGILFPLFMNFYLPAFILIAAIPLIQSVWKNEDARQYNSLLQKTAQLLLLHSLLLTYEILRI